MTTTTTLTGSSAIAYAERIGGALHKYADPTEGARHISLDEAREIAKEDPSLVWMLVSPPGNTTPPHAFIRSLRPVGLSRHDCAKVAAAHVHAQWQRSGAKISDIAEDLRWHWEGNDIEATVIEEVAAELERLRAIDGLGLDEAPEAAETPRFASLDSLAGASLAIPTISRGKGSQCETATVSAEYFASYAVARAWAEAAAPKGMRLECVVPCVRDGQRAYNVSWGVA